MDAAQVVVPVGIGEGYQVVVGAGLMATAAEHVSHRHLAVIADAAIRERYAEPLQARLAAAGARVRGYAVPSGEQSKGFAELERLLRAMVRDGFDREAAVVAVGGGVVGDLAGFCAACFLRGVPFYQFPTSLLAMVDASVGGKTGINLPEGKNLVGAFWQPQRVVADVETLRTLGASELRQGAVEAYKAGLLADDTLRRAVAGGAFSADASSEELIELVARAVRVKAEVVAADSHERGVRAHLNLGHTLGHALEILSRHRLPHGEAVAYGLLYAAHLSRARGWADLCPEIRSFLAWVAPGPLPDVPFEEVLAVISRDKKRRGDRLRLVLLRSPGDPVMVDDLAPEALAAGWNALREDVA